MDLGNPLQSLIPSLDSAVLGVLARTESALGQSQIHRLAARGSRPGLALAIDRLVAHGLVLAEPSNAGHVYRLNRAHLLAAPVLVAADARRELLRRLSEACDRLEPPALSAAVFGSVARAESSAESDVDLLLVVPDDLDRATPEWQDQVRRLESDVVAWTGNRLEVVVVSQAHLTRLAENAEPLVDSWRTDARTLAGTDVLDLLPAPRSEADR